MVRFSSLRSLPSFFLFICWLAVRVPVLTGFCSPLLENQAPPGPPQVPASRGGGEGPPGGGIAPPGEPLTVLAAKKTPMH